MKKIKQNTMTIINKVINWFKSNKDWINRYTLYLVILFLSIQLLTTIYDKKVLPDPEVKYVPVVKWKDSDGNLHNRIEQLELQDSKWRDSIAKLLKVNAKNIKDITLITSEAKIKIKDSLIYVDSNKTFVFSKKDNYLALNGVIDQDKRVTIDLGLKDTLNIVTYNKSKFFKTTTYVDVTNKNPYNQILSGYSYAKSERIKRFGIGPQIGYDPINSRIYYGIGIQYSIIRF